MDNNVFNYANLIYTTNKKQKITVYFFAKGEAWFEISELGKLFDVPNDTIIDCVKSIKNHPLHSYVELKPIGKDELIGFFCWEMVQLIGEKINPAETQELTRWVNMMIQDYPKERSAEFLENLRKAINYKPSSDK